MKLITMPVSNDAEAEMVARKIRKLSKSPVKYVLEKHGYNSHIHVLCDPTQLSIEEVECKEIGIAFLSKMPGSIIKEL